MGSKTKNPPSFEESLGELEALVERLAILHRSGWIADRDLPDHVRGASPTAPAAVLPPEGVNFDQVVGAFETDLILQALDATQWNKNQAARLLGLKRTTLVEKIRSKGLKQP